MPEAPLHSEQPLSLPQLLWRIFKAVLLWLLVNLLTFVVVSFVAFSLLNAAGLTTADDAFTLAVICAIPAALMVSSLVAGRRLLRLAWRRYRSG
jgi:hypothetical protein